jgi:beta-glucanase (GH16 family)
VLFFLVKENKAQSLPINDPTWTQMVFDDFSGPSLDPAKWTSGYWGNSTPVNNGDEYNDVSNLLFTNPGGTTYLSIKCETMTPMYWPRDPIDYPDQYLHYKSGTIFSTFQYKYGYWEMSAKLPAGYKGYWPAFWLYGQGSGACGYWDEIDILENGAIDSQYTDRIGENYHYRNASCVPSDYAITLGIPTPTVNANTTTEHKYGMLWEPGKMTWYFDDMPVQTVIDPVYTASHAINTLINFAIPIPSWDHPIPGVTVFPAYFDINYVKVWQLQGDCLNHSVFCSNFNATTWNSGGSMVKQYITIGGSGCSDNINTNSDVHFWATDFVLLDEGTTITSGSSGSFSAYITNCPN